MLFYVVDEIEAGVFVVLVPSGDPRYIHLVSSFYICMNIGGVGVGVGSCSLALLNEATVIV